MNPDQLAPRAIAAGLGLICVMAALMPPWQRPLTAIALGVGVSLVGASFWVQLPGMHSRSQSMVTEALLGDPVPVAKGILLAAAPAVILAVRIGRMDLGPRQIWLTGLAGIWLPAILSVTLMSFAKIWGVRFFWRPSLPIEFQYAFWWMVEPTGRSARGIWPLSLTLLAPCLICAIWINDVSRNWPWNWRKLLALVALAAVAWSLMDGPAWPNSPQKWLWSVVAVSVIAALARLMLPGRRVSTELPHPTTPYPPEI